ncbi:hypothetical protein QYE76_011621 [Lolium multiflorum]|uniref:Reverse transcriptase zinc-binding domain-containing protein n=1 Tax=Lolium multiflorum TaxID=4521 RepID=A0AAD8X5T1_LOLMU|nr:hypothetical protein QYE76_011621 [Lolium multiflorum]
MLPAGCRAAILSAVGSCGGEPAARAVQELEPSGTRASRKKKEIEVKTAMRKAKGASETGQAQSWVVGKWAGLCGPLCLVPSKVKIFLWRLAKQSLPTNDVRHHRWMADNDQCKLCGAADSWRHALLDCTMSRCVWALVDEDITEHMCRSEEGGARKWLANLIETLKPDSNFCNSLGDLARKEEGIVRGELPEPTLDVCLR